MPISQCPGGHYYDDVKYAACPHCGGDTRQPGPDEDAKTVAMLPIDIRVEEQVRMRLSAMAQDEKTIGIYKTQMKADPVVGWLVSVDGPEKGRDYRLHTGRNFLGRSLRMDVSLADDSGVSRENHCSVVYDPADNTFSVAPGDGTNTYINGAPLNGPAPVTDGDTIRLGGTELAFAAFCKGERKWL